MTENWNHKAESAASAGTMNEVSVNSKPPADSNQYGKIKPPMPMPKAEALTEHSVGIMGLTDKTCRWPMLDDKKSQIYCGCPVHEESVYCRSHTARAYVPRRYLYR